jgi:carboxyl-terminal processing protease
MRPIKYHLISSLMILLALPYFFNKKTPIERKSTDRYWAESGLVLTDIQDLISNGNCLQSEKHYLSCASAVNAIAEKKDSLVTTDGDIRLMTDSDVANRLTEKLKLSGWKKAFNDKQLISFEDVFLRLSEKNMVSSKDSLAIAAGINAYLSVFKDPHTYIIPLALYEEVISANESKHPTLGILFRREPDALIIKKVYEGSSAAMAGLKKADRITAINSEAVSTLLPSKINDVIKMKSNDRMFLTVLRADKKIKIEVIKTDKIFPSVRSKILSRSNRNVGLITVNKFSKGVCDEMRTHIIDLQQQNIAGLIVDMRDNPGGQVDEAACVINLFVKKGRLLFETRYLNEDRFPDKYFSDRKPLYTGSLAVLINSGSASASEIVAGSLRDHKRATLIGERTFGKGTFQDGRIWKANPKIAIFETGGFYYFPSGWTPQLVGIEPDITVAFANTESLREEDQYLYPVIPMDIAFTPNNIDWLITKNCDISIDFASDNGLNIDDPQINQAHDWLQCGDGNVRNGSL